MKRLCLLLAVTLLLAACENEQLSPSLTTQEAETEGQEMKDYSYEGDVCSFALDAADGTGFVWAVAYKTENLEVLEESYRVPRSDPTSVGGRGNKIFSFRLADGKDAVLILKYARPWENGADYHTYRIGVTDGRISEMAEEIVLLHRDLRFENRMTDGGMLGAFVPKAWNAEPCGTEEEPGLRVFPAGSKKALRIFYAPGFTPEETGLTAKQISLTNRTFTLYTAGEDAAFRWICGENGICCENEGTDLYSDALRLLDDAFFETR